MPAPHQRHLPTGLKAKIEKMPEETEEAPEVEQTEEPDETETTYQFSTHDDQEPETGSETTEE